MIRKHSHRVWCKAHWLSQWAVMFGWSDSKLKAETEKEASRQIRESRRLAVSPTKHSHKERDWMNHPKVVREQIARRDLQNQSGDALYVKGARRNKKDLYLP